jgi:Predicted AAA-ATPase/PD-(D/E)XK nuclease superfamily
MNLPTKILPIGIESFAKIRTGNFYYVDKTEFAWMLAQQAGAFFLSRPRRFGKSLLLDMLKELFEGHQALFEGLFIHDKWDWSRRFPVIWINLGDGVISTRAELDEKIREILTSNQERLGVRCTRPSISGQFSQLIELAHEKYGQPVVILVDEYDKPILDNLADRDTTLAMREGLKNLYSAIKGADSHIRLTMLTGVSKFGKVNLFSGVNNLRDITLSEQFSAICGYTDADVDSVFSEQLPGLDREQIRRWYNGYNWTGTAVYNPFDLLLLFAERQFDAWWCSTGTPTFLFDLMQKEGFFTPALAQLEAGSELISALDVDNLTPLALLFQCGYLTIHQTTQSLAGSRSFVLGYPNQEVEQSMNATLLAAYTGSAERSDAQRRKLEKLLASDDLAGMRALFQSFFAGIPHHWYTNNEIAQYEGFYASVFYSYFAALGLDTRVEDATNLGRIDMALKACGRIWLFEFKVVETSAADASAGGRALQQIKDKGYADKYRAEGLPIHLIGVEFSKAQRNVVGFEFETIQAMTSGGQ